MIRFRGKCLLHYCAYSFTAWKVIFSRAMRRSGSGFYYFRTQTGMEIDLIINRGQTSIGWARGAVLHSGSQAWHESPA
jgi:hypothetical protein